jgi:hypothetical protein
MSFIDVLLADGGMIKVGMNKARLLPLQRRMIQALQLVQISETQGEYTLALSRHGIVYNKNEILPSQHSSALSGDGERAGFLHCAIDAVGACVCSAHMLVWLGTTQLCLRDFLVEVDPDHFFWDCWQQCSLGFAATLRRRGHHWDAKKSEWGRTLKNLSGRRRSGWWPWRIMLKTLGARRPTTAAIRSLEAGPCLEKSRESAGAASDFYWLREVETGLPFAVFENARNDPQPHMYDSCSESPQRDISWSW